MVKGVIAGLRTLFWALVLLFFVTYAVGLILRQTVGEDRVMMEDRYSTVLFSSMPWSMFMVFRCVVGECVLPDGSPLVSHMHHLYGYFFVAMYCITIIFVVFGIFNLIAATFVETVMQAAMQKRQLSSEEEAARVFIKLRQLILKFGGTRAMSVQDLQLGGMIKNSVIDTVHVQAQSMNSVESMPGMAKGGSMDAKSSMANGPNACDVHKVYFHHGGQVSREDFTFVLEDQEVHNLFDDLEVHIADRTELFDVIDADGNGSVDVSELILGILKLRSGGADKSDMVATILGIRAIQRTTHNLMGMLQDLREVTKHLRPEPKDEWQEDAPRR